MINRCAVCNTSGNGHSYALAFAAGAFCMWGVFMPSTADERPEPVTVDIASERLRKRPGTIRSWATRYQARKLARHQRCTVYDWHDLKTIARQIRLGLPVPATAEERDELRAQLRAAAV